MMGAVSLVTFIAGAAGVGAFVEELVSAAQRVRHESERVKSRVKLQSMSGLDRLMSDRVLGVGGDKKERKSLMMIKSYISRPLTKVVVR
jgi:hypothetical protein